MKKNLFIALALFIIGITQTYALEYISIEGYGSSVANVCMGMTDTLTVSVDPSWESDLDSHSWILAGDLSFASGYDSNSNPCKVVVPSDDYGKGRVIYKFRDGRCSSMEYFDVFKLFACPQGLEIKGPECIVDSQEVVYSVDPMLTKNLGAQIGIDSYTWNVLESNQSFVHRILYVSSDSSSVTFKVGHVDPQNPPVITVSVGQCNEWQLSKTLGNATPKPELQDTMYLPVGFGDIKVGVINPKLNMEYTWTCPSFAIEPYGTNGDSAIIHITGQDADKMEFEVYVNATYAEITCNTSADTMKVVRTWGYTGIFDKNNITDSCYTLNNSYTFAVEGELPINAKCDWRLPQGWNFYDEKVSDLKTITIYPTSSAKLVDTLFVKPLDAHDPASPDTFIVHVKPTPIPIARIKQDSCLVYNQEGAIYVDTTGLSMPEGVEFEWNVPDSIKGVSGGTDTLRFIPDTNITIVQVKAKGISACDGEYTSYNVIFKPQAPESIICPDYGCISINMPDTLKFYVENSLNTQTYSWSYTSNLTPFRINNDTIELIINGTPNAKDTVWVKAIQNNQDCPESDSIFKAINIQTTDRFIEYDGADGGYIRPAYYNDQNKVRTESGSNFYWYLLYQGGIVIDAITDPDERIFFLIDGNPSLEDVLGTDDLPTDYVIVCEYTPSNSCNRVRLTYPQGALPSNFTHSDTLYVSELPLLNPNRAPKKRIANTLNLHPNPSDNILYLNLDDNSNFGIRISNMEGELVYSSKDENASQYEVNVSSLPQGKYIVVAVRNGERVVSGKFVKK